MIQTNYPRFLARRIKVNISLPSRTGQMFTQGHNLNKIGSCLPDHATQDYQSSMSCRIVSSLIRKGVAWPSG